MHHKLRPVFLVIPLILICIAGIFASLNRWEWLEDKCVEWYEELFPLS